MRDRLVGEIKVKREKRKDSVSPYGDGIFFAVKGEKSGEASGEAAKVIVGIADTLSKLVKPFGQNKELIYK